MFDISRLSLELVLFQNGTVLKTYGVRYALEIEFDQQSKETGTWEIKNVF